MSNSPTPLRTARRAIDDGNVSEVVFAVGALSPRVASQLESALGARWRSVVELPLAPVARYAMSIFAADESEALAAFILESCARGVASLCVTLGHGAAWIGPLSVPGRAGCGYCAWARRVAARASAHPGLAVEERGSAGEAEFAHVLAREMLALADGGDPPSPWLDQVLRVDGESVTRHPFVPLADCRACGGFGRFPRENSAPATFARDTAPEEVVAGLGGWLDPFVGVVSRLAFDQDTDDRLPIVVTAAPPHVVDRRGSLRRLPIGWGKGSTMSAAILSAVGEAIERYAPSLPEPGRLTWARPEDLVGDWLDPRTFASYSDEQYARPDFPFRRFDPSVRHPWVRGVWLEGAEPVWVPATSAYLSLELAPEQFIGQGTSNGLAAATTFEEAALRAIFELIERDAFMAAWFTARQGHRLLPPDDPCLQGIIAGVEALGAKVEMYVLPTSACGTTALCIALGEDARYPGVTIGLGADFDPAIALRQAVLELGQTGPYLQRMMQSQALSIPAEPACVRDMLDHAAYYFPRERAQTFDRIRSAAVSGRIDPPHGERSLARSADLLRAAGVRVALIDVSSSDVRSGPFRVVRAVSPDLQGIAYGHGLDRPIVPRVRVMGLASDLPAVHPIW